MLWDLLCQHADHQFRKVTSLCISKNCKNPRGLCFECTKDLHKNHPRRELLDEVGIAKWLQELKEQHIEIMRLLQTSEHEVLLFFSNLKKLLQEQYNPEQIIQQFSMLNLVSKTNDLIHLKTINQNLKTSLNKQVQQLTSCLTIDQLKTVNPAPTFLINQHINKHNFPIKQKLNSRKQSESKLNTFFLCSEEDKDIFVQTEREKQKRSFEPNFPKQEFSIPKQNTPKQVIKLKIRMQTEQG